MVGNPALSQLGWYPQEAAIVLAVCHRDTELAWCTFINSATVVSFTGLNVLCAWGSQFPAEAQVNLPLRLPYMGIGFNGYRIQS